jgi:S1/P1 Nuclease
VLPVGEVASAGPAEDCVVDKIDQFTAELLNPATAKTEQRLALQFLLHFVGDVHQPLHSSDDHDAGGNRKSVTAPGLPASNLHRYWDVEFVAALGPSAALVAPQLIAKITDVRRAAWSYGTAADRANETYEIGKAHAYGMLPTPTATNEYTLPAAYVSDAIAVVGEQLSKAGVRLAFVLNKAFQ